MNEQPSEDRGLQALTKNGRRISAFLRPSARSSNGQGEQSSFSDFTSAQRERPRQPERLDASFQKRAQPRKYFRVGRAFLTLWTEPASDATDSRQAGFTEGLYREAVYSKVRRFIVVAEGDNFCTCVPIATYYGKGVSKRGTKKSHHAIVYTGRKPPTELPEEVALPGEEPMLSPAIRLDTDDLLQKLDPMSRIDYGKLHTVSHGLKVKNLGVINVTSMLAFRTHLNTVLESMFPNARVLDQSTTQARRHAWIRANSTVPFRRDPHFAGRGQLLEQVHSQLSQPASRVALVGLGGIGKTQLAIECAYQIELQNICVFWIDATNVETFEQSIRDILHVLDVQGRNESGADAMQILRDWLCYADENPWLIVLDNASDAEVLREKVSSGAYARSRIDYIPQCDHGRVLVTSRDRRTAEEVVDPKDIILVEQIEQEAAESLIRSNISRADRDPDADADVRELVQVLERLPLALTQAAAYIRRRDLSIQEYLGMMFRDGDRSASSVLEVDERNLRRERGASDSILLTLQTSFDRMLTARPSAADLLSLMSFFNCDAIPKALLYERGGAQATHENWNPRAFTAASVSRDWDTPKPDNVLAEFEEDLLVLRDYSLVKRGRDQDTLFMHRLVQLATRQWLKATGKFERWCSQFIRNLEEAFPESDFENWKICQLLLPHAVTALNTEIWSPEVEQQQAALLLRSGEYSTEKGFYAYAEMMLSRSLSSRQRLMEYTQSDELASMSSLATTYSRQERWAEAEQLQLKVVEGSKALLEPRHPAIPTSMNNLALTFLRQDRFDDARKVQEEVADTLKQWLGQEHTSTLSSMNNLALIMLSQGQLRDAEQLQQVALEGLSATFGDMHPDTIRAMSTLSMSYFLSGRLEETERLQKQVVERAEQVLGLKHPDTLRSMRNLSIIWSKQDRWEDAFRMQRKMMMVAEPPLGPKNPDKLRSMVELARSLTQLGQLEEAQSLQRSVEIWKAQLDEAPVRDKALSGMLWIYLRWRK